jgi:hypothetical protein
MAIRQIRPQEQCAAFNGQQGLPGLYTWMEESYVDFGVAVLLRIFHLLCKQLNDILNDWVEQVLHVVTKTKSDPLTRSAK